MTKQFLGHVPAEVWLLVAEHLSVEDLTVLGGVSRQMQLMMMPPLVRGYKFLELLHSQDEKAAVAFLMKIKSIDIRVQGVHAMTALHYAAMQGSQELLRLLARHPQHKALLNIPESLNGDTPLLTAFRYHEEEVFQLLLDAGTNLNLRNAQGESILHRAVKRHKTSLVRVLLSRGADPDHIGRYGFTPLILAIMENHLDLVAVLVKGGCDVEQPDEGGHRPLAWAVISDNLAVVEVLFSQVTDPSIMANRKGAERSPLVWAVMKGNLDMVRLLLHYGADIKQTPTDPRPPLIWAVIHCDLFVAEVLLQNGACPNEPDGNGQTALTWATIINDRDMTHLLLEHGADQEAVRAHQRCVTLLSDVE
jgi:ankyrin repeat protein